MHGITATSFSNFSILFLSSIRLARLLSSIVELSSASGLRAGTITGTSFLLNESCPIFRRDVAFCVVRILRVEDELNFVNEKAIM